MSYVPILCHSGYVEALVIQQVSMGVVAVGVDEAEPEVAISRVVVVVG
jgi:hypothetical protein